MQTSLQVRSRARRVLGPFFLATAGILVTGPQRHGGSGASQDITALFKASRSFMAAQRFTGHHGAFQDSSAFAAHHRSAQF